MLSKEQADRLIELLKEAARKDALDWIENQRQDELLIAVEDKRIEFMLSLKRNPYEIRLHLRTKRENVGLMRVDSAPFHTNPDGTEIRQKPHLHYYREGHGLDYATPIDWYDLENPVDTLVRFLDEANARFPNGIQLPLI